MIGFNVCCRYFTIFVLLCTVSITQAEEPFLFLKFADVLQIKAAVQKNSSPYQPFTDQLRAYAEAVKDRGPWTITDHPSPAKSGDPHDYYSEGPYWWPDPDNPQGPFIRKDGQRNPNRFIAHKDDLIKMYQSVYILSMAACFFDEPGYAARAAELLRVWFVHPETKMNPHLQYAQAIPNRSEGRNFGIIDTHRFVRLIEALNLLKHSGYWRQEDEDGVKNWFRAYLAWLQTSDHGLLEKQQKNNHATWWAAQVAAYAGFTGDQHARQMVWDWTANHLIAGQIAADGSFPKEEVRTRSLSYTLFNFTAFVFLTRMAEKDGVQLWTVESQQSGNLQKSLEYILPFIKTPENWTGEQITPLGEREPVFLLLVPDALIDSDLLSVYAGYRKNNSSLNPVTDPFDLLMNFYSIHLELKRI